MTDSCPVTSNVTTNTESNAHYHSCDAACISWTAIVLGALAIVGLGFLMNLLSLAAGISAFPSVENDKLVYASGGFIGLAVLTIIAMFIGGWLAGFVGGHQCGRRRFGEIYGLAAWSLGLIISILIASGVGQFVANSSFLISRNMPVVRMAAAQLAEKAVDANSNAKAAAAMTTEEARTSLSIATFATFSLFALGAISACFGGHIGMRKCSRSCTKPEHHHHM